MPRPLQVRYDDITVLSSKYIVLARKSIPIVACEQREGENCLTCNTTPSQYTHIHALHIPHTYTCTSRTTHTYMHFTYHTHIHALHVPHTHTCTSRTTHTYMHFTYHTHIHALHVPHTHTCTSRTTHTYMHFTYHTHIHALHVPHTLTYTSRTTHVCLLDILCQSCHT